MEQLVLSPLIWEVMRSLLPLAWVLVFNNAPRPLCPTVSPETTIIPAESSGKIPLVHDWEENGMI
jgi:hypothetical protein